MKELVQNTISTLLITFLFAILSCILFNPTFAASAQSNCLDMLGEKTQKTTLGTDIAKPISDTKYTRISSRSTVKSLTTGVYKKYLFLSIVGNIPVAGAAVMGLNDVVKKELDEKRRTIGVLTASRMLSEGAVSSEDLTEPQVLEALKNLHEVRKHIQTINGPIATQDFVDFIESESAREEDNLFCKITKKGKLRITGLGKKQLRELQNRYISQH
jgi:hypothetical protein